MKIKVAITSLEKKNVTIILQVIHKIILLGFFFFFVTQIMQQEKREIKYAK